MFDENIWIFSSITSSKKSFGLFHSFTVLFHNFTVLFHNFTVEIQRLLNTYKNIPTNLFYNNDVYADAFTFI